MGREAPLMATIVAHKPAAGSFVYGTASADTIIVDWAPGITVVGSGGNDDIRSGIPNPLLMAHSPVYATMYGDGLVFGAAGPAFLQGDWRGNDALAGGYGWIMKSGPGADRYEWHGNAPDGPLIGWAPQIDIARDSVLMDHSDDSRWADGFRLSDWDVIRLDHDSFRVRGVKVHAYSDNPIVHDQYAKLGFLPSGHHEPFTYFDVPAETPSEARAEANLELHHMAREGDFLL
jgi:hypothetical protein